MKVFNYLLTAALALNLTQANAQCTVDGSHYTANYSSGWNYYDLGDGQASTSSNCIDNRNGSFYSAGNTAYFFSARCGREMRITSAIPTVNNTSWTMDFKLQITENAGILSSNSPAAVLASLTADPSSLVTSCSGGNMCTPCGSYPKTNMDAIWVELMSDAPTASCSESQFGKNWRIVAHSREGNHDPHNSAPIGIPSGLGTYYIRLQRSSDQWGSVSVYSDANYQTQLPGSPQCFYIATGVNGLDNLNHEVMAQEDCQRVFNGTVSNLKISNGVPCAPLLNPSFTMPATICGTQSFNVNGSATTGGASNQPVSSHVWVVEECHQDGTHFGPVWYHGVNGAPGAFTINPNTVAAQGGPAMVPGHYYRISLVAQNCVNPWSATSQVLYVSPVPTINMSGSSTNATTNGGASIAATASGGPGPHMIHLSTGSYNVPGNLISAPSPFQWTVYQSQMTTYYIVATNNVGCSSNKAWVVAMPGGSGGGDPDDLVVNPGFTTNTTPINAEEFLLETFPDDVSGYDHPDFAFSHIIQELDPNNEPYYTHVSSDCWNNYPEFENFRGFVSTGTGSFEQEPSCNEPGRFLAGHTYRVTTLMKTQDMEEVQYSVLIYREKSGQIVVTVDKNAPDMKDLLRKPSGSIAEDNFSIFPNPSEGIFTIDLGEETTGSMIEVKDALGKTVKSFEQKQLQTELNMTGYTKGIYFVTVTKNGNSITKKIVLE